MNNEYYLGDSLPKMKEMSDKSVDLIFTSLPDLSQTDFNNDVNKYQEWQTSVMSEFVRLIKDTGFIVISQTDRKVNGFITPNHITYINGIIKSDPTIKIKDEKIVVRNEVGKKDMYHFTYQYLTTFTRKGTFKRGGEILKDIYIDNQVKCPPKTNQYCWSNEFCSLIISTFTKENDFVLDPFAAAGPVLYAAQQLNRRYWGAEISPEMYNENFKYFGN